MYFVWSRKEEAFNPKNLIPTFKHEDESIGLWSVFLLLALETMFVFIGSPKNERYVGNLKNDLNQSAGYAAAGSK